MGDTDDNVYFRPHHRVGWSLGDTDFVFRRHRGNMSIDTTSDPCSTSDFRAIRDAVLNLESDTDVNTLGVAAVGSWWTTHIANPTGNLDAMRRAILDACG